MTAIEPLGFLNVELAEKEKLSKELTSFLEQQINTSPLMKLNSSLFNFSCSPQKTEILDSLLFKNQSSKNFILCPTAVQNLRKMIRALKIEKSIFLEGLSGVGKTSIIEYLSEHLGKKLISITITEQTDIADLFGIELDKFAHFFLKDRIKSLRHQAQRNKRTKSKFKLLGMMECCWKR